MLSASNSTINEEKKPLLDTFKPSTSLLRFSSNFSRITQLLNILSLVRSPSSDLYVSDLLYHSRILLKKLQTLKAQPENIYRRKRNKRVAWDIGKLSMAAGWLGGTIASWTIWAKREARMDKWYSSEGDAQIRARTAFSYWHNIPMPYSRDTCYEKYSYHNIDCTATYEPYCADIQQQYCQAVSELNRLSESDPGSTNEYIQIFLFTFCLIATVALVFFIIFAVIVGIDICKNLSRKPNHQPVSKIPQEDFEEDIALLEELSKMMILTDDVDQLIFSLTEMIESLEKNESGPRMFFSILSKRISKEEIENDKNKKGKELAADETEDTFSNFYQVAKQSECINLIFKHISNSSLEDYKREKAKVECRITISEDTSSFQPS